MEQGLAQTYGNGEGQNVIHHYAEIKKEKKGKKMTQGKCKKPKNK